MKTRVFLDANILFTAAWNPQGRSSLLFKLDNNIEIISSQYAVEEATRNLVRKKPEAIKELKKILNKVRLVVTLYIDMKIELNEKDKPIYFAAYNSKAAFLITGDRGFDALKKTQLKNGPVICSIREFFEEHINRI